MLVNAWIAGHRTKANSVRCIVVGRRDELFRAAGQSSRTRIGLHFRYSEIARSTTSTYGVWGRLYDRLSSWNCKLRGLLRLRAYAFLDFLPVLALGPSPLGLGLIVRMSLSRRGPPEGKGPAALAEMTCRNSRFRSSESEEDVRSGRSSRQATSGRVAPHWKLVPTAHKTRNPDCNWLSD